MFRRHTMFLVLTLLAMAVGSSAQKKPSLKDLDWLSGCWEGRQGESTIEEI